MMKPGGVSLSDALFDIAQYKVLYLKISGILARNLISIEAVYNALSGSFEQGAVLLPPPEKGFALSGSLPPVS